jgi:hypothetical protein
MRVWNLSGRRQILINTKRYNIKWEKDGASKLETRFKELMFPYWNRYIVLEQFRIPGSLLRVDFVNCNKRLAVEINGPQHNSFNKHFHRNSPANFLASIKRDMTKINWLEKNDFKVLELDEEDLDYFSPKYIKEKFEIDIV